VHHRARRRRRKSHDPRFVDGSTTIGDPPSITTTALQEGFREKRLQWVALRDDRRRGSCSSERRIRPTMNCHALDGNLPLHRLPGIIEAVHAARPQQWGQGDFSVFPCPHFGSARLSTGGDPSGRYIGKPITRREIDALSRIAHTSTTSACPTRHCIFVRSPHAHARIADRHGCREQAPGVMAVLTRGYRRQDRQPRRERVAPQIPPHPVLRPVACFVGEPVAVVVADRPTSRRRRGSGGRRA
jgi:hypothetical protein